DDVAAEVYKVIPRENVWQWKGAIQLDQTKIETNNKSVSEFFQSLYKVRRALANVPTYTIFDDHEITDDWNMTPTFCHDVYGNELGKRVVQNGLLAYALCQHWGNKPEDFV